MSGVDESSERDEAIAPRGLDPRTRTAILGVAAIGAFFAIGATAGWGARSGVSVFVGALIAVANLYGLARIVGALLGARAEGDAGAGLWGILAVLKVVGLFGGVWLLFASHLVDPMGLVVGWGALPIGVALGSLFSDKTERQNERRGKEAPPVGPPSP
ncbi:MAG: ATP synthase subunit I [Polyangiaceae bacterium]|jgi:hypothetical protein